jgi:alpha-amylase/alpha-mannosidase (GH57 family)
VRTLCLHGHFYQPPREHPWLGVVEPEPSAAPARDWNTRITAECYAPNAAARILDDAGRLADVVDNYAWTSFDFGPTLLAWMAREAPAVLAALVGADVASRARTGHGNAWAQAYGHPILPLCTPRDVRTQVTWGCRAFAHWFGRPAEGMWLPEMAVDDVALEALAEAGIALTMLAPHQARRIRPLGGRQEDWKQVTPSSLDTRRLYRVLLAGGRAVDVVFRDAGLSHDVAFTDLLKDGVALARRLEAAHDGRSGLVTVAADGETYGHHHRFGEMALAAALRRLRAKPELVLAGPAAFREQEPPTWEVEIVPGTSWSCVHGVERWRADCGCRAGRMATSQAWRAPLRGAIDWLVGVLGPVYETAAGDVLRDPWGARDRYVDCVLDPGRTAAFLTTEAAATLSPAASVRARGALELARHALLMQTSCGWFFDELDGREPVQVLRHAARALELAEALGARFEDEFMARLEPARCERSPYESGAALYRRAAQGEAATPARVGATAALLGLLGCEPELPGYDVRLTSAPAGGRLVGHAKVKEGVTGALSRVSVEAERRTDASPICRTEEGTFGLDDLFAVQRERVAGGLGSGMTETLREHLAHLPARAGDALALLDRAVAARIRLDLGPAQVQMLVWWRDQATAPERAACRVLARRLGLGVEV